SAVNADSYDPDGRIIPQIYNALTRRERHEELIHYAVEGAVAQVKRAYEIAGGKGAININVLWEMGGAQRVLHGVLERTKGLVTGVTCGAGMPYKLSEIAASYGVSYLPIISSARAFSALWKRAHHADVELEGVVAQRLLGEGDLAVSARLEVPEERVADRRRVEAGRREAVEEDVAFLQRHQPLL